MNSKRQDDLETLNKFQNQLDESEWIYRDTLL